MDAITCNRTSKDQNLSSRGNRKVMVLELCRDRMFSTTSANYTYIYLSPGLDGLGPMIESMVIHADGQNFGAEFNYEVSAELSFDGISWEEFSGPFITNQTAEGYKISTPFNAVQNFGMKIRFRVGVKHTTTATTGVLSVVGAIKFWS